MPEYAYTYVPGKLKGFLTKLRTVGVPNKVTTKWMESIGYKSSNDRSMVVVLQQIKFIDSSNTPTDRWVSFRGSNYRKELADAIKTGYSELYNTYPEAHSLSNDDLASYFSTKSSAGKQVITKTVSTFKTLCEFADFSSVINSSPNNSNDTENTTRSFIPPSHRDQITHDELPFTPKLHIDIQIHISPDSTPKQIEQIFESMAKHIFRIND